MEVFGIHQDSRFWLRLLSAEIHVYQTEAGMDPRSTNCAWHLWHQVVRLRRIVGRGDKLAFLFYLYPSIKSLKKKWWSRLDIGSPDKMLTRILSFIHQQFRSSIWIWRSIFIHTIFFMSNIFCKRHIIYLSKILRWWIYKFFLRWYVCKFSHL